DEAVGDARIVGGGDVELEGGLGEVVVEGFAGGKHGGDGPAEAFGDEFESAFVGANGEGELEGAGAGFGGGVGGGEDGCEKGDGRSFEWRNHGRVKYGFYRTVGVVGWEWGKDCAFWS